MSSTQRSSTSSKATAVRTLRDGFWDRTEVIRLRDGTLRVRKVSKGTEAPGPWGVPTLRSEIQYLTALRGEVTRYFPEVLAAWDNGVQLGYEMSYIEGVVDAGTIARSAAVRQTQVDAFQDNLSEVVFDLLHEPVAPQHSLAGHVRTVIASALTQLEQHSDFNALIKAQTIWINGDRMSGPRFALERLVEHCTALQTLDQEPRVRLHGDLFLENILLPQGTTDSTWPTQLTLVDPVSVAGVFQGHPLFDLVKYESYATGELLAMRSEKVEIEGFERPSQGRYVYRVRTDDPAIRPFRQVDWHGRFRAAYIWKYDEINWTAYRLLDAYFGLVMALCTKGLQRQARVLKAAWALNAAVANSPIPTETD